MVVSFSRHHLFKEHPGVALHQRLPKNVNFPQLAIFPQKSPVFVGGND
jgi:hypothetical protein